MSGRDLIKRALHVTRWYERRLRGDRFPGVAVLCYHGLREDGWPPGTMAFEALHVTRRRFEEHCRLISAHCHPITLDRWRAARAGRRALPARPVLVTFDDGYRTTLTVALPVLERYQVPAVIFACSRPIARGQTFWYDGLARARGEHAVGTAKETPWAEWRRLYDRWSEPIAPDDAHAPLGRDELGALAAHPLIEIGGHSARHPILANAPIDAQREEIATNLAELEAWIGRPVRAFAYPNGRPRRDYTAATVDLLATHGIDAAFTTGEGFAAPSEPPLERSRFMMLAGITGPELAHRLCYAWRRRPA